MYLSKLIESTELKREPVLDQDVVILPSGLFAWCDVPMVVPRSKWDEIYIECRASEPDIEPVFAAILSGRNTEWVKNLSSLENVRERYATLRTALDAIENAVTEDTVTVDTPVIEEHVTTAPTSEEVTDVTGATEDTTEDTAVIPEEDPVPMNITDIVNAATAADFGSEVEPPEESEEPVTTESAPTENTEETIVERSLFDAVSEAVSEDTDSSVESDTLTIEELNEMLRTPDRTSVVETPAPDSTEEYGPAIFMPPAQRESAPPVSTDFIGTVLGMIENSSEFTDMGGIGSPESAVLPKEEQTDPATGPVITEIIEEPRIVEIDEIQRDNIPAPPMGTTYEEASSLVSSLEELQSEAESAQVKEESEAFQAIMDVPAPAETFEQISGPSDDVKAEIVNIIKAVKASGDVLFSGCESEYVSSCVKLFSSMYNDYSTTLMSAPISKIIKSNGITVEELANNIGRVTGKWVSADKLEASERFMQVYSDAYCIALEHMADGDQEGALEIAKVFANLIYEEET